MSILARQRSARGTAARAATRAAGARMAGAAFAALSALALPRPAAADATIAVDTERHGDAIDIRATAALTADAGTAWRVLTDYGRYSEFIPNLRSSRVIARHGAMATVEQAGEVSLWQFRLPVEITFEVHEMPPGHLESRAVAGTLPGLTSSYVLTPAPAGSWLDYRGHVETGFALFRDVERAAIERTVVRQFRALADEIERRGVAARPNPAADGK
jgi:hypothetical protein